MYRVVLYRVDFLEVISKIANFALLFQCEYWVIKQLCN